MVVGYVNCWFNILKAKIVYDSFNIPNEVYLTGFRLNNSENNLIAWTKVEQIMSTLDTVSIQFNFREIQYSTNIEIVFHVDRLITLIIVQSI